MASKKALKKAAPKKAAPKKAVKKAAPKKAAPKKAAPKKAAPKKAAPKKAAPKKAAPKKAAPQKAAPKKAAPQKAAPQKAAPPTKAALKKSVSSGKTQPAAKPPQSPAEIQKSMAARKRNTEKYASIRVKLVQLKEDLLKEAETAMSALPDQTVFPDLGDQASAETDRNFMLRLRGREQRLITKIEEAIDRIDRGEYGKCDSCSDEISFERLMARPVATLCIDCKTEQEEEEKILGQ